MGSSPSKRIQSADVHSRKKPDAPERSFSFVESPRTENGGTQVEDLHTGNNSFSSKPEKGKGESQYESNKKHRKEHLANELEETQTMLTQMECENLNLHDQIQNLEQQLEFAKNYQEENTKTDDFTETVELKQQAIEKLEKEVENKTSEMTKLRIKFKKKLRIMKTKFAESKNEASLQLLELKEEMVKLREENELLKNAKTGSDHKPHRKTFETALSESDGEDQEDSSRMKIILDLSSRVSEQDAQITELENRLHERERYISHIEKELKESNTLKSNVNMHEAFHSRQRASKPLGINAEKDGKYNSDRQEYAGDQNDGSWYTNKTFAQLSGSNSKKTHDSSNRYSESAREVGNGVSTADETDDLKSIAEEMKQLQLKKKRKGSGKKSQQNSVLHSKRKDNKSGNLNADHGISLHASVANHRLGSAHSTSSVLSKDSALSYESDDSVNHADYRKNSSDTEFSDNDLGVNDVGSERTTPIDKSNIRQISGLGTKSKRRQGLLKNLAKTESMDGKPPVYSVKPVEKEISDSDMLLNSIDEDMLHYSKSVPQGIAVVST